MKITMILAPYDSGHLRSGFGRGPDALIDGGLVAALELAGHEVEVKDIGKVGDPQQRREVATGFAVCNAVAALVATAQAAGRFPVVLAGNCLTAAGAVAGEDADSIVWFDQHGDLNTPETSIHGFLDGMALSTVLGLCWRPMAAAIPGFQSIDPSRCLLVDARDLDPNEAKLLNTLPVLRAQCSGVLDKVEWLKSAEVERTHLHVDLDVLDPRKLQVNRYASAGGPSPEQLSKTVASLARSVPVVGLTVTAYDPAFDGQGEVPPVVGRLMVDFLAALERI